MAELNAHDNSISDPQVSILMGVYNAAPYVDGSIQSVMLQTYRNFELYIVDDGSTDGSREVIESALEKYDSPDVEIHYFPLYQNSGFAWHDEIEPMLKGKYVCIISGDDEFESDKLYTQVSLMESRPELAGCFTYVNAVNEQGIRVLPMENLFNNDIGTQNECLKRFLSGTNFLNAPSMMYRLDVYREVGRLNYKYRQSQDYALWVNTVFKYPITVIPQKLTTYRIHSDSLGSVQNREAQKLFARETEEILFNAFLQMQSDTFVELYGEEITQLFAAYADKNIEFDDVDVRCLKILVLFSMHTYVHSAVATRLYYIYSDEYDFNIRMSETYGFTRSSIHSLIKSTNLYNLTE